MSSTRDWEVCLFIQWCMPSARSPIWHTGGMQKKICVDWINAILTPLSLVLCGLEQVIKVFQSSVKIKMIIVNNTLHHWRIKWNKTATVKTAQRDLGFSLFWVLVTGIISLGKEKLEKQWRNIERRSTIQMRGSMLLFLLVLVCCPWGRKQKDEREQRENRTYFDITCGSVCIAACLSVWRAANLTSKCCMNTVLKGNK